MPKSPAKKMKKTLNFEGFYFPLLLLLIIIMSFILGCYTALITQFTEDGSAVDYEQLETLVESQINEGVNGLVPVRLLYLC